MARHCLLSPLESLVAIAGKVAAGWGCPPSMNRLAVGFGMVPRGEVGLIFAGIGKGIAVVDEGLLSAVVLLVVVTTVLAPILLLATMGSDPVAAVPFSAGHH
jgi:Kef-type K+ transport system membrane component KefB